MTRKISRLDILRRTQLVTPSTSPFEAGARSATDACALLEAHGVPINLATLRWFQNVGLIEKPAKEGRNAVYSRAVLDEVASLRVLQNLFGRTVEQLKELRRRGLRFTEVVQQLLRLQTARLKRGKGTDLSAVSPVWADAVEGLALVEEFFERVLDDGVHPGCLVLRNSVPLVVDLGGRR